MLAGMDLQTIADSLGEIAATLGPLPHELRIKLLEFSLNTCNEEAALGGVPPDDVKKAKKLLGGKKPRQIPATVTPAPGSASGPEATAAYVASVERCTPLQFAAAHKVSGAVASQRLRYAVQAGLITSPSRGLYESKKRG